jgi:hypothetical protein
MAVALKTTTVFRLFQTPSETVPKQSPAQHRETLQKQCGTVENNHRNNNQNSRNNSLREGETVSLSRVTRISRSRHVSAPPYGCACRPLARPPEGPRS